MTCLSHPHLRLRTWLRKQKSLSPRCPLSLRFGMSSPRVVVVHSFSRFFRDAFGLEFYVRKLAKHGVRLVSITQELQSAPDTGVRNRHAE